MSQNIEYIVKIAIVFGLVLLFNSQQVNANEANYFDVKLSLKLAIEDQLNISNTKISKLTQSQKAIVNLVQNFPPNRRVSKDTILALRMDDCSTGEGRLVVYDKQEKKEVKDVTDPFILFDSSLERIRNGLLTEVWFSSELKFQDSETSDFAVNFGALAIVGRANFLNGNSCPSKLNASILGLGFLNIKFQDDVGEGPVTENLDVFVLGGSKISAKFLSP
ncbi:hypothetical protein [Methylotuvimicrobium sp. KM2]|uniref:hypothetical protein n=1 Tax=Methylotuvimicrobium sp. KM2 TaxID=3133976 RepID=UPI003100E190